MSSELKPADLVNISVEDMLMFLKRHGEVNLTVINGKWWCYFRIKSGDTSLSVDGDRKEGWSVWDAVNDCYVRVLRTINQGRRNSD